MKKILWLALMVLPLAHAQTAIAAGTTAKRSQDEKDASAKVQFGSGVLGGALLETGLALKNKAKEVPEDLGLGKVHVAEFGEPPIYMRLRTADVRTNPLDYKPWSMGSGFNNSKLESDFK